MPEVRALISQHPDLIGRYQDDVIPHVDLGALPPTPW
jgi:hypothetical protein